MKKYQVPGPLVQLVEQDAYEKWLHNRAAAHVKRDRKKRANKTATIELYKLAIHKAVCQSNGLDAYTKENLDWHLLRKYNNQESKKGGRQYKRQFALLPSVDHVGDGSGPADFVICAWRTNDAKHDMTLEELLEFCEKVLKTAGRWPGLSAVLK